MITLSLNIPWTLSKKAAHFIHLQQKTLEDRIREKTDAEKRIQQRKDTEDRIQQRADYVITSSRKKYHKECLMRYMRKSNWKMTVVIHLVNFLELRRANVLQAMYFRSSFKNPRKFFYLLKFSRKLLKEMEDISIEVYVLTGDEDFLYEINHTGFATPKLLGRMVHARSKYVACSKRAHRPR